MITFYQHSTKIPQFPIRQGSYRIPKSLKPQKFLKIRRRSRGRYFPERTPITSSKTISYIVRRISNRICFIKDRICPIWRYNFHKSTFALYQTPTKRESSPITRTASPFSQKEEWMHHSCDTSTHTFISLRPVAEILIHQSASFALINSRLRRAMLAMLSFFGQTASQARVFVQLPKPSSSILATIALARFAASGRPWGRRAN